MKKNKRQHDYDSNNQLDGIELIQAMTHYERMDIEDRGGNDENYPRFSEQQFMDMGLELFKLFSNLISNFIIFFNLIIILIIKIYNHSF